MAINVLALCGLRLIDRRSSTTTMLLADGVNQRWPFSQPYEVARLCPLGSRDIKVGYLHDCCLDFRVPGCAVFLISMEVYDN